MPTWTSKSCGGTSRWVSLHIEVSFQYATDAITVAAWEVEQRQSYLESKPNLPELSEMAAEAKKHYGAQMDRYQKSLPGPASESQASCLIGCLIQIRSTVQPDTLSPVWNELWLVKNVPVTAVLNVQVLDKDNGPTDDYIGNFSISVSAGAKEAEIEGPVLKRTKGTFWLKV